MPNSRDFEQPPTSTDESGAGGNDALRSSPETRAEFSAPDLGALTRAAFEVEPDPSGGIPEQMLAAHSDVANALRHQEWGASSLQSVEAFTSNDANIQAVAIGLSAPGEGEPGEPVLQVFVAEATSPSAVRNTLVAMGVQSLSAETMPVTVRRSGVFDALSHRFRIRPGPGGVSIGHTAVTAGTLGGLCVGRSAPRDVRLMALSNNHVLANSNAAAGGDCVILSVVKFSGPSVVTNVGPRAGLLVVS